MSYLLDTMVVSEVRRRRPNPGVRAWLHQVRGDELYLSVLVLGEVRQGVERLARRDEAQAAVYRVFLDELRHVYRDRLLAVDATVADRWGHLNVPDPLPVVDGLLAATALVHGLVLVTRNTADVERSGVDLLNPFSED